MLLAATSASSESILSIADLSYPEYNRPPLRRTCKGFSYETIHEQLPKCSLLFRKYPQRDLIADIFQNTFDFQIRIIRDLLET